jgi:hypothetical protein
MAFAPAGACVLGLFQCGAGAAMLVQLSEASKKKWMLDSIFFDFQDSACERKSIQGLFRLAEND